MTIAVHAGDFGIVGRKACHSWKRACPMRIGNSAADTASEAATAAERSDTREHGVFFKEFQRIAKENSGTNELSVGEYLVCCAQGSRAPLGRYCNR